MKFWLSIFNCVFLILSVTSQEPKNRDVTIYIDSIQKLDEPSKEVLIQIEKELLKYDAITYAEELGNAYHELGKFYNKNEDYVEAIKVTKKAVDAKQKTQNVFSLNKSLLNLFYFHKGLDKDTSSDQLSLLEAIIDNGERDKYTFRAYNEAAILYIEKGDYYKALNYCDFIIKNNNKEQLVEAHISSIWAYSELDVTLDQLPVINYHNSEIENFSEEIYEDNLAVYHNNLATIYVSLGLKEKAIKFYEKALHFYIKIENNENVGALYNNLGDIYFELGDVQKAKSYFNKALKTTDDPTVLAYVIHNQGYYLQTNRNIDKIPYYQKSINYLLGGDIQLTKVEELPSIENIKRSTKSREVLEDLIQIANTWFLIYSENKEKDNLLKAKRTLILIDELISYIRLESSVDKSKLFWINKGVDSYMLAVKVCYLLGDVENAFYFMEKNKALLLLENLNYKGNLNIATLDSVKNNHVSKSSNFIEYILNENEGYGVFCSKSNTEFFKINNVEQLLDKIEFLKRQFESPFNLKEDNLKYIENANYLFQHLFPFKNAVQRIKSKRLTVVSDYKINGIPFEALIVKPDKDLLKETYFIQYAEVSYLHSASVLMQLDKRRENHILENKLLAVAPRIFKMDSLPVLERSSDDVEYIESLFSTQLLKDQLATKTNVLSAMSNHKIIHFNTHAGVDPFTKEPWIAFYDQKMSLQELYNYPLNSELIVLDACKSDTGKLEMGEGIMSLSRAFTYNGAKSVIASQWNVNEETSSEIFKTFYKELHSGKSKSAALHNAKLAYLDAHQLSEVSPYYWASMMLTGNTEKITIRKASPSWYRYLIIIGVLVAFCFLYKIYISKSK